MQLIQVNSDGFTMKSMKGASSLRNGAAEEAPFVTFLDESNFNTVKFHLCIVSTVFILQFVSKIACSMCSFSSSLWCTYSRFIWVYFFSILYLFWNLSVYRILFDGMVSD